MKTPPSAFFLLTASILASISCQPPEMPLEKSPMIQCPLFNYSAEEAFREAYAKMDEKDRKDIQQTVLHAAGQINIVFRNGRFDKDSLLTRWENLYEQEIQPAIRKIWSGPEVDGNCLHPVYLELLNQWNEHGHDPESATIRHAILVGLNYNDDCRNLCLDSWKPMLPHLSKLEKHGLYRTDEGYWLIRE